MKPLMWSLILIPALTMAACSSEPSSVSGGSQLRTNNVTGVISTTLSTPLEASYSATKKAVDDMKFTMTTKALDAMKGVVTAKTADGTDVDITLVKQTDKLTKVEVDAGPTRTEVARALIARIQERAGT